MSCDVAQGRVTSRLVTLLRAIVFLAALLALDAADTFAHGDVHGRILLFTQQMEETPRNASLYFQRGELYRVDGDYTSALVDLDRAAQLEPGLPRLDFCRGRVRLEAGQPAAALELLNRYLAGKPQDAEAYATRARTLLKLSQPRTATADFTTALGMSRGSPELYIERAAAWQAAGQPEESIRGLDEGIRVLGPLVTLELPAIDLEVGMKRFDAALARIDAVTARLQRKETWLVRRAQILMQAGRAEDAQKNYLAALAALDRLPPTHRGTRATLELETRIRAALVTNTPTAK